MVSSVVLIILVILGILNVCLASFYLHWHATTSATAGGNAGVETRAAWRHRNQLREATRGTEEIELLLYISGEEEE